jgi:hypothetical protein
MEKEITIALAPNKHVTFKINDNSDTSFVLNMTHMWLDLGLLMGHDKRHGFMYLCTEDVFAAGRKDSLRRSWRVSDTGYRYRAISGSKKMASPVPACIMGQLYANEQDQNIIKSSFERCYGKKKLEKVCQKVGSY